MEKEKKIKNKKLKLEKNGQEENDEKKNSGKEEVLIGPAWRDEDDDNTTTVIEDERLKRKLKIASHQTEIKASDLSENLNQAIRTGNESWAQIDQDNNKDIDELFQKTKKIIDRTARGLPADILDVHQLQPLHHPDQRFKPQLCKFHPNSYHFVTIGSLKTGQSILHLWKIDGQKNQRSSSFKIPTDICSAEFYGEGHQMIFASGKKGSLITINFESGKNFKIYKDSFDHNIFRKVIVSDSGNKIAAIGTGKVVFLGKNAEFLFDIKLNQFMSDGCFSSDESKFYIGSGRFIYLYDLKTKYCLKRWTDDAGLQITSITTSQNGKYLAVGAESGYVNIYSAEEAENPKILNPKILKSLSNTVVSISQLLFNSDSQLLTVLPKFSTQTISLIHVPTFKIFKPISNLGLRGKCLDISRNSTFLAVGHGNGSILLYQLDYYN